MVKPAGSPWHAGELALQEQAGVARRMDGVGRRVVRDYLPEPHRAFFAQLPFVVAGSVANDGSAWAGFVFGRPGFMQSPTERMLHVDAVLDPHDPVSGGLGDGASIGLLGIELHTRRRNRLNGTVRRRDSAGFDVDVAQSFGNCPKYIQLRDLRWVREPGVFAADAPVASAALDERARRMIAGADTFFVATYAGDGPGRQVDVSHRGGNAGFVRVADDGRLTIPDYAGNQFFATLGNIVVNPRAGLLFTDFETGNVLQMTGTAQVELDPPELADFPGAERLWRFTPYRTIYRRGALPMRWTRPGDPS